MASNEAIELIEQVLGESERWQYRQADLLNKKRDDLDKKIENEKKKVEYYGKDPDKLEELEWEKSKIPYVNNKKLINYRKGTDHKNSKLNPKKQYNEEDNKISRRHKSLVDFNQKPNPDLDETLYNPMTEKWLTPNIGRLDKKKRAFHERINKRTAAFDTTAKHEAACILIEALNTLLNE